MKRAFLFGLGSFLILAAIVGLFDLLRWEDMVRGITGGTLAVVCAPLAVIVIRAARLAPPLSRLRAVFGWLLAFDAVLLLIVGIIVMVR